MTIRTSLALLERIAALGAADRITRLLLADALVADGQIARAVEVATGLPFAKARLGGLAGEFAALGDAQRATWATRGRSAGAGMSRSAARRAWPASLVPLALAALLVGATLRLAELGAWSFWADEVASLNISAASIGRYLAPRAGLERAALLPFPARVAGPGRGRGVARLPSALAGVLALPLVWRIGASWGDEVAGVLAMGLLAVSPLHIWYSREVRMYVLACLFAVAAFYCTVACCAAAAAPCRGVCGRDAAGGLHRLCGAVVLGGAAGALPRSGPALRDRRCPGPQPSGSPRLVVALGFACYLPVFGAQIARGNLGFLGLRLAGFMPRLAPVGWPAPRLWPASAPGRSIGREGTLRTRTWIPWIVIVAFLALTLLAAVPRGFSVKRQLLVFWPFVVLAAAWALRRIKRRSVYAGVLVASLAATAVLLAAGPTEDWRGAAAYISTVAQPGDTIYAQSDLAGAALAYYYRGPAPIYAPGAGGVWPAPPPAPERGATAWLAANNHPALQNEVAALSARLSNWGQPETRAAFARFLRIIAYRTDS